MRYFINSISCIVVGGAFGSLLADGASRGDFTHMTIAGIGLIAFLAYMLSCKPYYND